MEEGGFLYDRDSLGDELPYWVRVGDTPHLVIPISYETNDNRYNEHSGFVTADDFFTYMKDAFDMLYREGERGEPKMMMLGLHDRIVGRPARAAGLERFLDYVPRARQGVVRPRRRYRPALDGGAPGRTIARRSALGLANSCSAARMIFIEVTRWMHG